MLLTVTDMLIAMLGICSKEELDEEDEEAEEEPVLAEGEEAEPELTGKSNSLSTIANDH